MGSGALGVAWRHTGDLLAGVRRVAVLGWPLALARGERDGSADDRHQRQDEHRSPPEENPQHDDERTVGRLLNNLGGLSLLLGKPHQAIEQLKASFAVAVEVDSKGDAAQAMGGLATVHLRLGDWEQAEHHAREALRLLEGREDFLDVMGQAQLELGRSLLDRIKRLRSFLPAFGR